jgi:hypothetical protein
MALQATVIATNIAGLTITGVTVKDLTAIPEEVQARDCPLLVPDADGFMSGLTVDVESFGLDSQAKKSVYYTLNYKLFYAPTGGGRGLFDVYQGLVAAATAVLDAIIAHSDLAGAIDTQATDIMSFGLTRDVVGNAFHGATFGFRVREFINN